MKNWLMIFGLLTLFSCNVAMMDDPAPVQSADLELNVTAPALPDASIIVDEFQVISMAVTICKLPENELVAEKLWLPEDGYKKISLKLKGKGNYEIKAVHTAVKNSETITFTESAQFTLKPGIIVRIKVIPGMEAIEEIGNEKENLVFWSKLDSFQDVTNPQTGPAGTGYENDGFNIENSFVEGKFGNAFIAHGDQSQYVQFPKEVIPAGEGCIEFWALIQGIDYDSMIPWNQKPGLVGIDAPDATYSIMINGNDGWGGGGLCGWAGNGNAATYNYYDQMTYDQLLVDASKWHHYALTWSKDGVKGSSYRMQLYLDGKAVGGSTICGEDHNPDLFKTPESGVFYLVNNQNFSGSTSIDNIKIWSYAKTDFSDRFTE